AQTCSALSTNATTANIESLHCFGGIKSSIERKRCAVLCLTKPRDRLRRKCMPCTNGISQSINSPTQLVLQDLARNTYFLPLALTGQPAENLMSVCVGPECHTSSLHLPRFVPAKETALGIASWSRRLASLFEFIYEALVI